jgi:putative transferase (TIGR04331 family)
VSNKKVLTSGTCLAVSNCKNCWDTNSRLAFISGSIPDYLDAEWLKTIDHVILDGPWESREYRIKSRQFVVERVARYRKELSPILNLATGFSYGEKAWGFLLDSWLMCFVSVVYDRVQKLENAQNQLDDVYLNCFRDDLPLALTTIDFVENCFDDQFNQQLLGDIAAVLGIRAERCVDNSPESHALPKTKVPKSLKHRGFVKVASLLRPLIRWWSKRRKPLVILDGYFPFAKTILLFLCSLGKILIVPSNFLLEKAPEHKEDQSLRELLKVKEEDRFDLVANDLIAKCFPVSLLEGIKDYSDKISELEVIPVLGSAVGFYFNEEYKILASRVIENGNKIIGFQHGGNYNFEKNEFFCAEYFDGLNVDKFYRWREKSFSGKLLPTAKLATLSSYKEARKKRSGFEDILFVSTSNTRFVFRVEADNADNFTKKIITQHSFYLNLHESVVGHLLLRPHPVDRGWRYKERWLDLAGGGVRFDPNCKLYESLLSCRIFVTDHISTTWLEAFYMDVPVLLFFDIEEYFVLDEVGSLFEELRAVGIFHPSAESAASFLNENYKNIESWWEMPETKVAVDNIRDYFFNYSGHFTREWTQELVSLRSRALKGELNL